MHLFAFLGNMFDWATPRMSIWITPVWILSVGALVGLMILLLLWGVVGVFSRRAAREAHLSVREGALRPILWTLITFSVFAVIGTPAALNQNDILGSVWRLPFARPQTYRFDIPANAENHKLPVRFRRSEVKVMRLESEASLSLAGQPLDKVESGGTIEIAGGTPYQWRDVGVASNAFPDETITHLYVSNPSGAPAELNIDIKLQVVHPEAATIVWTAASVVALFGFYFLLQLLLPKLSAVAVSTTKSEISAPLFLINLLFGAFLLFLFIWVPYNTFGDDIKVLKDAGLTTIMVLGIITALWAASSSVAEEIEGRTALTVLSKPISRRQFLLGKYAGICWTVAVMFVILGAIFLVTVSFKLVYDARESAKMDPSWQECHLALVQTVPGLVLAFMEAIVLAAISVAISTRLPLVANFLICTAIYALGHLTPAIVSSSSGGFEPVAFVGQLIATIVPNLDTFNLYAGIAAGSEVPHNYLLVSLVYCILYGTVAMLLALVMFEDRDLA